MSSVKPSAVSPNEIWLLLDSQIFGGIETHVIELANGLREQSFNVRVVLVAEYQPAAPIIEKLIQSQLCHNYLSDLSTREAPNQVKPSSAYQQLLLAVKEHNPRLIHAHGYKASLLSKLAKLRGHLLNSRQVSTYHAGESPKGRVWFYDFLDRYTSFTSNHSLAVSEKIRQKLPSRSTVLNNFIAIPDPLPAYTDHFAFVGRLSEEKGADNFIELSKSFPKINFDIYGDGPELEKLKLLSNNQTHVIFHGHQHNMATIWDNVGVLLITSRFEGLPMAALEAMGRGIPVISLSVGNLPSLIDHKQNGFLSSSTKDLPEHVEQWLLMNEQEKSKMRFHARETIKKHYSTQAVIPQIVTCYFS